MDRKSLLVAVVVAVALAGCGTTVAPPDQVAVDADSDAFAVTETDVWTAGSTTEYRSQVVVAAVLQRRGDDPAPVPEVAVEFTTADGETATVAPTYRLDRRRQPYDELGNATVAPGETVEIKAVFDPAAAATVENATLRVRG
jgi:hypothetical protein